MPSYRPSDLATELREALAGWAAVELARFFSGDGLRLDGVQFACVLRGRVWLHADEALREALRAEGGEGAGEPFTYAGAGGKQVRVLRFASLPEAALDDAELLLTWCRRAWESARRAPPAKPARKSPVRRQRATARA